LPPFHQSYKLAASVLLPTAFLAQIQRDLLVGKSLGLRNQVVDQGRGFLVATTVEQHDAHLKLGYGVLRIQETTGVFAVVARLAIEVVALAFGFPKGDRQT
jgi:hypothetical protein